VCCPGGVRSGSQREPLTVLLLGRGIDPHAFQVATLCTRADFTRRQSGSLDGKEEATADDVAVSAGPSSVLHVSRRASSSRRGSSSSRRRAIGDALSREQADISIRRSPTGPDASYASRAWRRAVAV